MRERKMDIENFKGVAGINSSKAGEKAVEA